jgi:hypothetical protein
MLNTNARDAQIGELLRHLTRGGHSEREVARIERQLAELRASRDRDDEWALLTRADHQPRLRHLDAF